MRTYLLILRDQSLRWLYIAAFLGRVPYGVEALATIVYFHERLDSYAVAGLIAGAIGLGIAVGCVVQGRRLDRRGRAILVPLGIVHAVMILALIEGGRERWPTVALLAVGLAAGSSLPPTSSLVRTLYEPALGQRRAILPTAFALDSALTDFTYVAGPAAVSLLVVLASPAVALLFAAASALASIWILLLKGPHEVRPDVTMPRDGVSALRDPQIQTIAMATLPLGFAFGVTEVAFPAFASAEGEVAVGGLLLALLAGASAIGALTYGAYTARVGAVTVFVRGSMALPLLFVLPTAGASPLTVGLLLLPFGLVNGPWVAARNHLTGLAAQSHWATEAYAWPLTATLVGTSAGNAVAGVVVQQANWRAALVGGAAVTVASALVVLRQGRLLEETV